MKINVNGMSVEDILRLSQEDVSRMSRSDLAKVTSRLASAANKRIVRAKGTQYEETILKRAGGKPFSVKGKNQGQLQGEFARARNFFNKKTSSIKNAEKVFAASAQRIGAVTEKQSSDLWKIYKKLTELRPDLVVNKEWGSDRIQEMVRNEMIKARTDKKNPRELSPEEAFDLVIAEMNKVLKKEAVSYAEEEEKNDVGIENSDLFDIGENPFQR